MVHGSRDDQLAHVDAILGKHERALYVGAKVWRGRLPTGLEVLRRHSRRVECVEAWRPNVEDLRSTRWFDAVHHGDFHGTSATSTYDLVFWWHGPEHLWFFDAIAALGSGSGKHDIVVACPWGTSPQGDVGGNPYEVHRSSLLPEDFDRLGYSVSVFGGRDARRSQILAWRSSKE